MSRGVGTVAVASSSVFEEHAELDLVLLAVDDDPLAVLPWDDGPLLPGDVPLEGWDALS